DEAFRIFVRNSRFPEILKGDIRAVLAGCQLGERRVLELFERFGADTVLAAWALFEQQCRDTIRKTLESRIPDGSYESEDAVDGVLVRPGSILQPHWPAALGNRAHTLARVQSNVLALLALATGGDVPAPNSVYNIYFLRGFDRARNEFFLCSDGVAVGYGA